MCLSHGTSLYSWPTQSQFSNNMYSRIALNPKSFCLINNSLEEGASSETFLSLTPWPIMQARDPYPRADNDATRFTITHRDNNFILAMID